MNQDEKYVRVSFDMAEYTGNVTALGTTRILEAIRRSGNRVKFYQASCYDENTRVLTKKGLKKYSEIKKDDSVYTINEKTNEIELKPIKQIIIEDYKGEMIHFKNRKLKWSSFFRLLYSLLIVVKSGISWAGNHRLLWKKELGRWLNDIKKALTT